VGEPSKLSPIESAIAALSAAMAELLAGDKPSRFREVQGLARTAAQLQQGLASSVDAIDYYHNHGEVDVGPINVQPWGNRPFNDAVDLNREILMTAQKFLQNYLEVERVKAVKPIASLESRLLEAEELGRLIELRLRFGSECPDQIDRRVDYLLNRIGELPHEPEPESGALVHSEPVRGHQADGER
jgi:hypothetical protein